MLVAIVFSVFSSPLVKHKSRHLISQGRRKQIDIGGAEKSAGGLASPGQCPGGAQGAKSPEA